MEYYWLPDEIWEQIFFSYDVSPKDIYNCFKVSANWNRIISRKLNLPTILLAEVITHLANFLGKRDLLQCRSTCHQWREIIDTCIEPAFPFSFKRGVTLNIKDDLRSVPSEMMSYPKTLLPFRRLCLRLDSDEDESSYEILLSLVTQFGRQVSHLGLFFIEIPSALGNFFSIFQHFPNLKTLMIVIISPIKEHTLEVVHFQDVENREISKFSEIPDNHLTTLENLEALKFEYYGSNPLSWLREFSRRAGPLLNKVTFEVRPNPCSEINFGKKSPIPQLPKTVTELSLAHLSLQQGGFFKCKNFPLKSLSVEVVAEVGKMHNMDIFWKNRKSTSAFFQLFVNILKNFSGTLEKFSFFCGYLPCFRTNSLKENWEVTKLSRKCLCNIIFNIRSDHETESMEKSELLCSSLKMLNISHYFLHPRIFQKVMKMCGNIKKLKINDFSKLNLRALPSPIIISQMDEIVSECWPESCESLEKIKIELWWGRKIRKFCFSREVEDVLSEENFSSEQDEIKETEESLVCFPCAHQ